MSEYASSPTWHIFRASLTYTVMFITSSILHSDLELGGIFVRTALFDRYHGVFSSAHFLIGTDPRRIEERTLDQKVDDIVTSSSTLIWSRSTVIFHARLCMQIHGATRYVSVLISTCSQTLRSPVVCEPIDHTHQLVFVCAQCTAQP